MQGEHERTAIRRSTFRVQRTSQTRDGCCSSHMKYAIIIPDGCADEPQESLGGRTPLQAAHIAGDGRDRAGGRRRPGEQCAGRLPAGQRCGQPEPVGLRPAAALHRPCAAEAAAQGIELGPDDWAIRCNLVTIEDQTMRELHGRSHFDRGSDASCWRPRNSRSAAIELQFVPGVSYRNLLIYRGAKRPAPFSLRHAGHAAARPDRQERARRLPARTGQRPVESTDERQRGDLRRSSGQRRPRRRGQAAGDERLAVGPGPHAGAAAVCARSTAARGKMITAVDLLRGLAALIGWERIEVPGATGYLDTDYAAKGRYAVEALPTTDIVCVHVEATDEASHEGRATPRSRPWKRSTRHIVGPLHEALQQARRLSHPGLARPSHAAAHQDAQPRLRAVRDRRHRRQARRGDDV